MILPKFQTYFKLDATQSVTKNCIELCKQGFTAVGTTSTLPHPLPPIQCCQCWHVAKTKLGELQTPRNNIEQGERKLNFLYPPASHEAEKKMCDILFPRLVLSTIVEASAGKAMMQLRLLMFFIFRTNITLLLFSI